MFSISQRLKDDTLTKLFEHFTLLSSLAVYVDVSGFDIFREKRIRCSIEWKKQ